MKYVQMFYTTHALVRGNLVPCAYALIPIKTEGTYTSMPTLLDLQQLLYPTSCQIDFEMVALV